MYTGDFNGDYLSIPSSAHVQCAKCEICERQGTFGKPQPSIFLVFSNTLQGSDHQNSICSCNL